jgi:hypothetical protein
MFARVTCAALIYTASAKKTQTDPLNGYSHSLAEAERRALELNPPISEARLGTDARV